MNAARELAGELEGLTDGDRKIFNENLDDMVRETPRTAVAISRFRKMMVKVGKCGADAFRNLLVDVLSEAVRKQIWQ